MPSLRTNLVDLLKTDASLSGLGGRVHQLIRPQGGELPALVTRCIDGQRGAVIGVDGDIGSADDGTRKHQFELVVWAASSEQCEQIGDLLLDLLHGNVGYDAGEMRIDSSWLVREYDGDRVADVYSDAGAYAITYVFEFLTSE